VTESATEKIKRLEIENKDLKNTVSMLGKRTESEIIVP